MPSWQPTTRRSAVAVLMASGQGAAVIPPCEKSDNMAGRRNGSSKGISVRVWIIHLDASFQYSRHTIAGPPGEPLMGMPHAEQLVV